MSDSIRNGTRGQVPVMFAFASVLISIVGAVATGAYALGRHTGDSGIHEPGHVKEQRIRSIVDRELSPQLQYQSAAIARIERELELLRKDISDEK